MQYLFKVRAHGVSHSFGGRGRPIDATRGSSTLCTCLVLVFALGCNNGEDKAMEPEGSSPWQDGGEVTGTVPGPETSEGSEDAGTEEESETTTVPKERPSPRLGDGEVPVQLVSSYSPGSGMACARSEEGYVRCWGQYPFNSGVPGYGTRERFGDDEHPFEAGDMWLGGQASSLDFELSHLCAVLEGKGAGEDTLCWGFDSSFELGNGGGHVGWDQHPAESVTVPLAVRSVQVATTNSGSCALGVDGKVRCWGNIGTSGQRGDYLRCIRDREEEETMCDVGPECCIGDGEDLSKLVPIELSGNAIKISGGSNHMCALLEGGDVQCWGSNRIGQLGYGVAGFVGSEYFAEHAWVGDDESPADMGVVDVGGKVVDLRVTVNNTCVLLEGGEVRCWGINRDGVLGLGLSNMELDFLGDNDVPTDHPPIRVGGKVEKLVESDTCVIVEGGNLRCWGPIIGFGNPEIGKVGDDEHPDEVPFIDVGGKVLDAAIGAIACAIAEDPEGERFIRCWGNGEQGELGIPDYRGIVGDDEPPSAVPPVYVFTDPVGID